jgi:Phospholipid-translocating P-type ATPase C-terminal
MLAIGDGANDVAMIQAADVGVGIAGKEGRQAANNSDYIIGQFRFLARLLLVHGHLSRFRLGRLIKYFFYKNGTFAAILFYYQFFCGYSGQAIIDGAPPHLPLARTRGSWLPSEASSAACAHFLMPLRCVCTTSNASPTFMKCTCCNKTYSERDGRRHQSARAGISAACYNVLFTSIPSFFLALLDRPVRDVETLLRHPQCYNKSRGLTTGVFWKTAVLLVRAPRLHTQHVLAATTRLLVATSIPHAPQQLRVQV